MARKAVVLDGAKADYKAIKGYVKGKFGEEVWMAANKEFKSATKHVAAHPESGVQLEELSQFGFSCFRKTLVRQTWIVYEYDNDFLIFYMFIHMKRDFRAHLMHRMLGT